MPTIIFPELLQEEFTAKNIQIQMADSSYKKGDIVKTLLTFRASGTEPLVRVYAYTVDSKLTVALKDIGENIVKGAFKTAVPVLTDTDEYKKLQSKILNIESIENLRDFFTDQKIMSLSEDDSEIILEYIQALEDRFILDLKDLFYTTLATSKYINDKFDIILSDLS